jgi:hypothetical protein
MAVRDNALSAEPKQVATRRVHYISGFDPRGARFYHRLYREESAKQAPHMGARLEIGERRRLNAQVSTWSIQGSWENLSVHTDYQFMSWDDLVRQHWDSSMWKVAAKIFPALFRSLGWQGFCGVRAASRNAWRSAIFPFCYLVLLAGLISALVAAVGAMAFQAGWIVGLVAQALATAGIGALGLKFADQIGVFWVARTFMFLATWGHPPHLVSLDQRAKDMADHIVGQQQASPVDEVLIVGHSVGAMLAVSVVAHILEKSRTEPLPAGLQLLTLGECIPYLSLVPTAAAFRRELQKVASDSSIPWNDVTIPADPLCFFKVDPVAASRLTPSVPPKPNLLTARIFRMFSAKTYAKLRWNKLRIHFQYLMASELPNEYDYFLLTAGPIKIKAAEPALAV